MVHGDVLGLGFGVWGLGLMVHGDVLGLGFGVWGLGLMVHADVLGFWVWGLGFRVYGSWGCSGFWDTLSQPVGASTSCFAFMKGSTVRRSPLW